MNRQRASISRVPKFANLQHSLKSRGLRLLKLKRGQLLEVEWVLKGVRQILRMTATEVVVSRFEGLYQK